jgi:hypothetical protein
MKTYRELISEVAQPKAGDEIEFKAKHDVEFIDHPASEEEQHTATSTVKKRAGKRIADYDAGEDMVVYEQEDMMTEPQKKKKEKIVRAMKRDTKGFKDRYGDDWKSVMYATATKQAMEESIKVGEMELVDGSKVKIGKEEEKYLKSLYKNIKGSNKEKMEQTMKKDKNGFAEILRFAKEVYEE